MEKLLTVIIGGIIAFMASVVLYYNKIYNERRSLCEAISGEIQAILLLINKRNYRVLLEELKLSIELGSDPPNKAFIAVPQHNYFVIFEANVSKIGQLPDQASRRVVKFYILLKSLLEDVTNQELFSRSPHIIVEIIDENLQLLDDLIEIGESAISNLRKKRLM